ncbi:hypothetical protein EN741_28190 [Mesorhizobium sp. M4B.F.Ca.ET.019.03.1.1]|uniref:hypothetical protein n=1 Tax=Mesorhizobium sp. M4B.F.Ca.ET.019.03.1.1 TaxID=2496651 RepID=UPI000FCAA874|nr:hypothetical protein [Mesorhizobium sp. M4B.F.Ca.ET.019.03.1.1]RVD35284.1 hypothetical protein EN741_28190 [Mesorhizobium sp. M4B.F.Ca.ET.019.03.1.1]
MPNTHVPAAGEAMPAALPMAAAALQIERDAAFIATAMTLIHGGKYCILIDHQTGFVAIVPVSS